MNSFWICLNAITPIFLLIGAGYVSRLAGFIQEEDIPRMNAVAFRAFMPVMCFYNIYSNEAALSIRPQFIAFAVGGVLVSYVLSWLYSERFVSEPRRRGVVIQGLYRSNFLFIGVPLASGLLGAEQLGVVSVCAALVIPLFNVLAVVALEAYNGQKPKLGKLVLDIVKNPLIIGTVLGVIFALLRLRLPAAVESAVRDMGRAASPLLLFLLGAFFKFGGWEGHRRELIAVCLGRLVLIPAVVLTLSVLLGFRGIEFVTLIAIFASSTATNSFPMAQQMGGDAALAGDIVVMTSALCSFTLFGWSLLFMQLGMF